MAYEKIIPIRKRQRFPPRGGYATRRCRSRPDGCCTTARELPYGKP